MASRAAITAEYSDTAVQCRSRRHKFDDIPVTPEMIGRSKWRPSNTIAWVGKRCDNCGCERHEVWNSRTGAILFSRYRNYPEGYRAPKAIKPKDFRVEYLKRRARRPVARKRAA